MCVDRDGGVLCNNGDVVSIGDKFGVLRERGGKI